MAKLICGKSGFRNRKTGELIRYYCKARSCDKKECHSRRASSLIRLISDLCNEYGLNRFFTLTLGANWETEKAWKEISHVWSKFRKRLERKFEGDLKYVAILEKHTDNDRPHIHGFWNRYIDQDWISKNWNECGGGEIVWIEKVDSEDVHSYVGKQLAVHKYVGKDNVTPGVWLEPRKRGFWRSENMKSKWELREKSGEWETVEGIVFDDEGFPLTLEGDLGKLKEDFDKSDWAGLDVFEQSLNERRKRAFLLDKKASEEKNGKLL